MGARLGTLLVFTVLAAIWCGVLAASGQVNAPLKDFTDIKLEEYGIKPVTPKKDPKTGFLVGGKNATDLIKSLSEINGLLIRTLEAEMRPGAASTKGFLGKKEKLLDVMAADNRYVVDDKGLTHQELARHLHAMGAVWQWQIKNDPAGKPFLYHGRKYQVKGHASRGFQMSP